MLELLLAQDYLFRTQITLSGNPLQASGPGPLLHSSVLQSVLQPLLLQYTTVLKSVLLQYTILLMSVHHGALLMQYTTCAKLP